MGLCAGLYLSVPNELYDKFSQMVPLFVDREKDNYNMPDKIKMYENKDCRKTVKRTKKLLGVIKVKRSFCTHLRSACI